MCIKKNVYKEEEPLYFTMDPIRTYMEEIFFFLNTSARRLFYNIYRYQFLRHRHIKKCGDNFENKSNILESSLI